MQKESRLLGCLKENKKVVNKNKCHPELDSGSHLVVVLESGEIPYQVRNDKCIFDGNHAFTLIELLVVVLIIGILAAVALPQYQKAVLKSRYVQTKLLTKMLADSEELYYLNNGVYANSFEELDISMPAPSGANLDSNWVRSQFGSCMLRATGDECGKQVSCSLYEGNTALITYSMYLHHATCHTNKRMCSVPNGSALAKKVCLSETGDTAATGNSYTYP